MKRVLMLLLVIVMCISVFAACGSDEEKEPAVQNSGAQSEDAQNDEADAGVKGEMFDAGEVSVLVPEGWMAFPVADVFSDEEGALDPTTVQICKGAETDWDIMTKPYVQVFYYGPDSYLMEPDKGWYDEAEDLDPINTGEYSWNGFTGYSFGYYMAILWTDAGNDVQYQVNIILESDDGSINIDDADVLAILESIQ